MNLVHALLLLAHPFKISAQSIKSPSLNNATCFIMITYPYSCPGNIPSFNNTHIRRRIVSSVSFRSCACNIQPMCTI